MTGVQDMTETSKRHHVIIVGAGFGGLDVANSLAGANVTITIIDRRNHHLFQPLLYQVAGASLATSEIAWPIRHLFRKRKEVTTLMAEVVGVDKESKQVRIDDGSLLSYDTLILATGATHAYFGNDEWEPFAPGLKTLEDAAKIRGRILSAFEEAERTNDMEQRTALQTFVIIGGGPTGVELSGTIAELAKDTLSRNFRSIDPSKSRVILIEAGPRLLSVFPENLSEYTKKALEKLGVEVMLGTPVTNCSDEGVVYGGNQLKAKTIIWAAGVKASPAARWLEAESDRAGRVVVNSDLTVPDHPEIFVIGDTAAVAMEDGTFVPGIGPAAKQEGKYVARIIDSRLKGKSNITPFKYKHMGNLATIGHSLAVIHMGKIKLRGMFAWWVWKLAHIYFLIGAHNRLSVALSWIWNHSIGYRGSRIILTQSSGDDEKESTSSSNKR